MESAFPLLAHSHPRVSKYCCHSHFADMELRQEARVRIPMQVAKLQNPVCLITICCPSDAMEISNISTDEAEGQRGSQEEAVERPP